ncbi:MAG: hypothetical protein ABIR29_13050 [Chthoniobacterales bacterium]
MKKILVDLENCYGIRKLKAEFNFADHGNVFAIYAPNGMMKTSLANTFRDLVLGQPSSDRIWPDKASRRTITDEGGKELTADNLFVIEPYNDQYRSERISMLLANDSLKKRYEAVYAAIDEKTQALVEGLQPLTLLGARLCAFWVVVFGKKEPVTARERRWSRVWPAVLSG